jgi:hypothetical protein
VALHQKLTETETRASHAEEQARQAGGALAHAKEEKTLLTGSLQRVEAENASLLRDRTAQGTVLNRSVVVRVVFFLS